MLSPFQIGMLVLFLASAWVSRRNWRGLLWLSVMMTSYLVSSEWWRVSGASAELVAGLCDAATVMLIYLFAKRIWELAVASIFTISMMINLVYLAQNLSGLEVISHNAYATALELVNVLALALIGGVAAFERRGRTDGIAFRARGPLFGAARSALAALSATEGRRDR